MGKEFLLLGLIVLVVLVVFVLPQLTKKRNEGFATSGISAYDAFANNRDSYTTMLQKKYNRFSDNQDVTRRNFMDADTDRDIDLASTQLKAALRTANIEGDPTKGTLLGAIPDVPPETLAPVNQVVMEARKCEALNSRANCATLDDPKYSNCGVCVQDRTTMFPQTNDKWKHGGLLILPDDRRDAEVSHGRRKGPVQYSATVGECPPGFLFVDRAQCERKSNQLDCKEAGENGGYNGGKSSEGKDVIGTQCANAPVIGSETFVYDTKDRTFNVNLRVLSPIGSGITKVYVNDARSGAQVGYGMSETPGKSFVVTVEKVKEAQAVNVTVVQETPYRSQSAKPEVFIFGNGYNQTVASSRQVCERIGARSATQAEFEQAFSEGMQACSCGNTTTDNVYPMQTNQHVPGCGSKGIMRCSTTPGDWNGGFGNSWCFGIKPPFSTNPSVGGQPQDWFTPAYTGIEKDKPTVWSKWGPDYQAPFYRGVIMQWEMVDDAKRMPQSFEPSITAVNDQGPNTVTSDGLKTFKLLRRFGTFKSSTLIRAPRPSGAEPMLTNQFWIWGNIAKSQLVKFKAQIPGTFLKPVYEEDNPIARRGQLVNDKSTFQLLQISPCLKDGQVAGAYSDSCLSNLFLGSGGDINMGKLASRGMVDPYDGSTGQGLKDLNKLGDMDKIMAFLSNLYSVATSGRDETGNKVGGGNGKARAAAVNKAAQWMFGFDVTSPCEDVEETASGDIVIVPRSGALDADCLQWLYQNAGTDKDRGSEDPNRFASPRRGGVTATYTSIADRFSGLKSTEGTPKKRETSPFQTCQPSGSVAPVDASGRINPKNVNIANSYGGIKQVQDWYNSIHKTANYALGKTKEERAKHTTAVEQCYGTVRAADNISRAGCGVAARYVYIIPSTLAPAWYTHGWAMNIPQVEVFDTDDKEIAKGKKATGGAQWNGEGMRSNPDYGPAGAVNGKNYPRSHGEGEYHSAGQNADADYWMVDLGKMMEITKVKVYLRTDCCTQRLLGAPIQLRDAYNNVVVTKHTGKGEFPSDTLVYTVKFDASDLKPAYTADTVVPGSEITLLSGISWDRVLRHAGFAFWVHGPDQGTNNGYSDLQKKDASFIVRPALNGRAGYISFESVNYPRHYIRHSMFRLYLHYNHGDMNDDSTFKAIPAVNGDPTMVSFQCSGFPNHYIASHRDAPDQGWINTYNKASAGWDPQHHSWRVLPAFSSQ